MTNLSSVVVAVACAALVACDSGDEGQSCTLIGCGADGLLIELVDGSGGIPAGTYRVTAAAVTMKQCDFTLPATGAQPACRVGDAGVTWAGFAPETVSIFVTRDGQAAHSSTLVSPTYTETRPNGPGCDPVCRQAVMTITLE